MPNRLFQGIINQMREVLDRTIGVVDESGTVIACSELGQIGEARKGIISAGVFSGWITAHIRPLATPCTRIMRYLWTVRTI